MLLVLSPVQQVLKLLVEGQKDTSGCQSHRLCPFYGSTLPNRQAQGHSCAMRSAVAVTVMPFLNQQVEEKQGKWHSHLKNSFLYCLPLEPEVHHMAASSYKGFSYTDFLLKAMSLANFEDSSTMDDNKHSLLQGLN